jgi:hypothetical protein
MLNPAAMIRGMPFLTTSSNIVIAHTSRPLGQLGARRVALILHHFRTLGRTGCCFLRQVASRKLQLLLRLFRYSRHARAPWSSVPHDCCETAEAIQEQVRPSFLTCGFKSNAILMLSPVPWNEKARIHFARGNDLKLGDPGCFRGAGRILFVYYRFLPTVTTVSVRNFAPNALSIALSVTVPWPCSISHRTKWLKREYVSSTVAAPFRCSSSCIIKVSSRIEFINLPYVLRYDVT